MLPPGFTQVRLFTGPCSPPTGVYNPKAFVLHAASLGRAFAHCRRFSTAASRRSLGSVSVPVCRATLARPVGVRGLVGRYPANDLIPRRPVPGRNRTFRRGPMPARDVAGNYPRFPAAIPAPGVGYRRLTHPCATGPCGPVRLACLIHVANVHSEPGSNPSKWQDGLREGHPFLRVEESAGRRESAGPLSPVSPLRLGPSPRPCPKAPPVATAHAGFPQGFQLLLRSTGLSKRASAPRAGRRRDARHPGGSIRRDRPERLAS